MNSFTRSLFRDAMWFAGFCVVVLSVFGFFAVQFAEGEALLTYRMWLNSDWNAASGYLRIENRRPLWVYDASEQDQVQAVEHLRRVLLIADEDGNVLENSNVYASIGLHSANTGKAMRGPDDASNYFIERDKNGTRYYIRSGWTRAARGHKYFVAIGRELPELDGWLAAIIMRPGKRA